MFNEKDLIFYDLLENEDKETMLSPHLGYPCFIPLSLGMLDP
jgi:hypothetical protein